MWKLNRKVEYALIALKHMRSKKQGELTTAKEIADTYNCPFDATSRVMQLMVQANLLKSAQGSMGGYQIMKDLSRFSILDLIEIVLGPIHVAKCMKADENCELHKNCNIISPVSVLNHRLIEFYHSINLRDLLEFPNEVRTQRQTVKDVI